MAAQQQQRVVVKIPVRWLRQAATAITTGTGTGNVRTEQRLPTTRTIRAPVCYPLGSASFTTLPSPPPPLPGARMFQRGQNQPDETVRLVDMSMRCTACCLLCRPRQHGQEGLELDPCPTLSPPPALPLSHSPTLPLSPQVLQQLVHRRAACDDGCRLCDQKDRAAGHANGDYYFSAIPISCYSHAISMLFPAVGTRVCGSSQ